MQLKSPKLPPAAAAYYYYYYCHYYSCCHPYCDSRCFPFPVPSPGPSSRFKSKALTTTPPPTTHHLVLLSPPHRSQLTPRPPRGGRQDNHYHRGRLKRDLRGTSTWTWRRRHILTPFRMTSSSSPLNQPPYHTLHTDLSVYIEGQSSTHSPDNYHLRK
jgi:hypothetical protein